MIKTIKEKLFGGDYEYYDEQEIREDAEMGSYPSHLQPVQGVSVYAQPKHSKHIAQGSNRDEEMEIINFVLEEYSLTGNVCRHIQQRKPIVVNMGPLDNGHKQRALDYLSGATSALNGTITRVEENIFIFAPANVKINANLEEAASAKKQPSNTWSSESENFKFKEK